MNDDGIVRQWMRSEAIARSRNNNARKAREKAEKSRSHEDELICDQIRQRPEHFADPRQYKPT